MPPRSKLGSRACLGSAWGNEIDRPAALVFDPEGRNRRVFASGSARLLEPGETDRLPGDPRSPEGWAVGWRIRGLRDRLRRERLKSAYREGR
jgi:hypothetical protein